MSTEYNKKYYAEHKEEIIAHLGEKRFCEACNRYYHLYNLSRHNKSTKHLNNSKMKVT